MKTLILLIASVALAFSDNQLPIQTPPPPAPSANVQAIGTAGFSQYFYMVVANYASGAAQSQIVNLQNANATLSSGNYNQVGWNAVAGAINYDVLRLPSNAFTGTCTCSVVTASTSLSFSDIGGSVSSYTVGSPALASSGTLYVDNTTGSFPKLRVVIGNTPGTLAVHLAEIPSGATTPSFCTIGDIFFNTAVTAGTNMRLCTSTNTFTAIGGGAASSVAFSGITSGTNSTAAMVVGTGASLTTSGTGSITASALSPLSQNLLFATDGSFDIGASATSRPRSYFASGNITIFGNFQSTGGNMGAANAGQIYFGTRSVFTSPADGNILVTNTAGSSFGLFQFGGTTSAFPALKRSATALAARLADDTADAPMTMSTITMSGTTFRLNGTTCAIVATVLTCT